MKSELKGLRKYSIVCDDEGVYKHIALNGFSKYYIKATFIKQGYQLLNENDTFINGDEYGWGFCFKIGNKAQTSLSEGDKVPQSILCYFPRRFKR